MRTHSAWLLFASLSVVLFVPGCETATPQQNLRDQLDHLRGKSSNLHLYPLRPELLLSEQRLPNGNVERRYRYLGDCVFVVEVDPSAQIFVGARAVGSEKNCILPP